MTTIDLTPARRATLFAIASRRPGFSCQGPLGEFLDDYLVAESLLRRLISFYASDTSKAPSEPLNTAQMSAALNHFGLIVTPADIVDAFQGGPGKRGFKSARQLRNGFVHDLNPEDRDEIIAKHSLVKALIDRVTAPLLAAGSEV